MVRKCDKTVHVVIMTVHVLPLLVFLAVTTEFNVDYWITLAQENQDGCNQIRKTSGFNLETRFLK